uniref:F-box protein At2g07140-like n=1 Tax=Erigeron canadensis TaxID=72917 RepID=UPI001CB908AE|nr:F-box protein At2g07140-like [Erigeron canadensis]
MDCEAPDGGLIAERYHLPSLKYLYKVKVNAQTSLHGLICVCGKNNKLVLWNPLTGEFKVLINPCAKKVKVLGLYYTGTSNKDYKLLSVTSILNVHTYSLKSNSWRKVDSIDNYQTLSDLGVRRGAISSSTWFNGNLYFLIERSVLKFDTQMEKFTIIPTHPSFKDLNIKVLTMNLKKGVIHLGVKYETEISLHQQSKKACIQLWRMTTDEIWEKVGLSYRVDISMDPFHWLRNKTWLMIESLDQKLYKVDCSKSYTKGKKFITGGKSVPIVKMDEGYAKLNYMESFMPIDGSI